MDWPAAQKFTKGVTDVSQNNPQDDDRYIGMVDYTDPGTALECDDPSYTDPGMGNPECDDPDYTNPGFGYPECGLYTDIGYGWPVCDDPDYTNPGFGYPECEVAGAEELPVGFQLRQNYPNPFNPTTTIEFVLSATQDVSLVVYSINGSWITTLFNGLAARGLNSLVFDAGGLPNGVYLYMLRAENVLETKKMILLK